MSEERSAPLNDPELAALAAALRTLAPRPAQLERDTLMFRAGRASTPRGWAWPLATAGSTLLAAVLGGLLLLRPVPEPSVRIVQVPVPQPAPPAPEPPDLSPAPPAGDSPLLRYQQLQERVLSEGLAGLPEPAPGPPGEPVSVEDLWHSF